MTSADSANAAKQLDSVTDRVQETELDSSKAQEAMAGVAGGDATKTSLTIHQIRVARDDVSVIQKEFDDVTEDQAILVLKQASLELQQAGTAIEDPKVGGGVVLAAALRKLIHAIPGQ